jgi:hypothetical protein
MREDSSHSQREKNATDVQNQLLSQHVGRLEAQADRDAQEIFRLRRSLALAELSMAKQQLSAHSDEIRRLEGQQDVTDAASALLRQRELAQLRMTRQTLERELQEREQEVQRLHEQQLKDLMTRAGKGTSAGRHEEHQ